MSFPDCAIECMLMHADLKTLVTCAYVSRQFADIARFVLGVRSVEHYGDYEDTGFTDDHILITKITGTLKLNSEHAWFPRLRSVGTVKAVNKNILSTRFDALTTVGGDLYLNECGSLVNVNGFSAQTTVGGRLDLYGCKSLVNVDGFNALTTIGGDLDFNGCRSLVNVDGFNALTTIGGGLDINACRSLDAIYITQLRARFGV